MTALLAWLVIASAPVAGDALTPGAIVTLPPQVGVTFSAKEPWGVTVTFPWVLKLVSLENSFIRPSQILVEPGVTIRGIPAFTARVGFRWLGSILEWLALGGGLGFGFEAGATVRPNSSFELVARFGKGPTGFGLLTTRAELRLDGSVAWMVSAGAIYW